MSADKNDKVGAIEVLREKLPNVNDTQLEYVDAERSAAGELAFFEDSSIGFQVLAPNHNIDYFYVGVPEVEDGSNGLLGYGEFRKLMLGDDTDQLKAPSTVNAPPQNISKGDFRQLKSRLRYHAFAFLQWEKSLENDISVVLLLEWEGWRLMFTGDAERKTSYGGEFKAGSGNGSWNVMWHEHNQTEVFDKPLDFLKVGHHGSENASPWSSKQGIAGGKSNEMDKILDEVLPLPTEGERPTAIAVISTARHGNYKKAIPDRTLMELLGERVLNPLAGLDDVEKYPSLIDSMRHGEPALVPPDTLQPMRTDLAIDAVGQPAQYIEILFPPVDGNPPKVSVG